MIFLEKLTEKSVKNLVKKNCVHWKKYVRKK